MTNIELLNWLHQYLVENLLKFLNDPSAKKKINIIAANVIYYFYAVLNRHQKITSGIKTYVDTEYADRMLGIMKENTPGLMISLKEIPSKEFDDWFKNF
ncbi:MAG: hypothetical protein K9J16_15990 [Melioribacteraceae bacterium]|nr:hypothetical protein [Melioribacteraceae bacterium]MCF8356135.1 hypothetical protein [Melioribacteraceae bacterium]MCF8395483.1 hypothetical protein [Melioribacteraceae bacterium]MCF8420823.1 hypothetical protein [Melioribacteraceae bacterium]